MTRLLAFSSTVPSRKQHMTRSKQQTNYHSGEPEEKQANLCIKVPLSWRQWWVAHSKLHGVTMTDVIIEALAEKFGVPEER